MSKSAPFAKGLLVLICGLGLGWLTGLSASPVTQTVLAALLGLIVAIAAVLAGVQTEVKSDEDDKKRLVLPNRLLQPRDVSVGAAAILILGVSVGAPLGVVVRTNEWLGPSPRKRVKAWEKAGLTKQEAAKLLLSQSASKSATPVAPVLFATASEEECVRFRAADDSELEKEMAASQNPRIREFARRCAGHPDCLRAAVEELICSTTE